MKTINNFNDFLDNLYIVGMSFAAGNKEGLFTLSDYYGEKITWHTEDKDTDPWEWRLRVLTERDDIAYSKFFFKKGGYITKEWYPYFYAVRRGRLTFDEEYESGTISYYAKLIYGLLSEYKELPIHLIKLYGGFAKEDKLKFDNAMIELQMKFYITMCGRKRKVSKEGEEYGWSSTVFCLVEDFFDKEVIEVAERMDHDRAYGVLYDKFMKLRKDANPKKVKKFIMG